LPYRLLCGSRSSGTARAVRSSTCWSRCSSRRPRRARSPRGVRRNRVWSSGRCSGAARDEPAVPVPTPRSHDRGPAPARCTRSATARPRHRAERSCRLRPVVRESAGLPPLPGRGVRGLLRCQSMVEADGCTAPGGSRSCVAIRPRTAASRRRGDRDALREADIRHCATTSGALRRHRPHETRRAVPERGSRAPDSAGPLGARKRCALRGRRSHSARRRLTGRAAQEV